MPRYLVTVSRSWWLEANDLRDAEASAHEAFMEDGVPFGATLAIQAELVRGESSDGSD